MLGRGPIAAAPLQALPSRYAAASLTLDALTASGAGTVVTSITGSASLTLNALTVAAAGGVRVSGAASSLTINVLLLEAKGQITNMRTTIVNPTPITWKKVDT